MVFYKELLKKLIIKMELRTKTYKIKTFSHLVLTLIECPLIPIHSKRMGDT